MVADIDPHVIGITESWANKDIVDAELGYVKFRKDRREIRGGGVILSIKEYIQAYEITLTSEADCEEAIWCNIVTRNSTLTIGVVYQQEEDVKLQNAIREVCKGECVIMGDLNHGHIQWESLESAGGDDHQFLLLKHYCFFTQHVLEPTRGGNVLDLILSSQNDLVDNVNVHEPLGSSDHNQIHFNIKVKTGNRTSTKANIKR